jgi:putative salt-induced outer membrane protein YdiY
MRLVTRSTFAVLMFTLIAGFPATAQQTLELNNGDRLSGSLSGVADGSWVFAHSGGEITVPAADVVGFTALDPIGLRLADGSIVAATIATSGNQLLLTLTDGSSRTVSPAEVAAVGSATDLEALQPIEIGLFKPFSKFWGATLAFGFSNNSGNSRSRGVAFSFDIERKSPKDRQELKGGLSREYRPDDSGELETTVEKYYGSARLDVFLTGELFTFGFAGWERDRFQELDLRSTYTAGLGYQLIENDATDLRFFASGGARIEDYTQIEDEIAASSQSSVILGLAGGFRQKAGPIVFDWTLSWTPAVEDFGDYRLLSDASVTTTIFEGLGFRIGSRNQYNSRPRPDIDKHDWLLTTALTYSVGR